MFITRFGTFLCLLLRVEEHRTRHQNRMSFEGKSGSVEVENCGSVKVWQCGSMEVWQCGSARQRSYMYLQYIIIW